MILYNTLTAMLVQVRHAQVSGGGGGLRGPNRFWGEGFLVLKKQKFLF